MCTELNRGLLEEKDSVVVIAVECCHRELLDSILASRTESLYDAEQVMNTKLGGH